MQSQIDLKSFETGYGSALLLAQGEVLSLIGQAQNMDKETLVQRTREISKTLDAEIRQCAKRSKGHIAFEQAQQEMEVLLAQIELYAERGDCATDVIQ